MKERQKSEEEKKATRVMNVDYELVRELKRNGLGYEANKLIELFQETGKKNWKMVRRENKRVRNLIYDFKKRKEKEKERLAN